MRIIFISRPSKKITTNSIADDLSFVGVLTIQETMEYKEVLETIRFILSRRKLSVSTQKSGNKLYWLITSLLKEIHFVAGLSDEHGFAIDEPKFSECSDVLDIWLVAIKEANKSAWAWINS